jgi:hypothetical protein
MYLVASRIDDLMPGDICDDIYAGFGPGSKTVTHHFVISSQIAQGHIEN